MLRQEFWAPTQVRLSPPLSLRRSKSETRSFLEDIDENPLTYFLTPMDMDNDYMGLDDDSMFFDAGIEGATRPRETVRSVSPSSLEGLRKADSNQQAMSPDLDSDAPTTDDDDDEDFTYLSPPTSVFAPLRDFSLDGFRFRLRSQGPTTSTCTTRTAYAPKPHNPSSASSRSRGRSTARNPGWQTRSLSGARSRPNHLWKEPSPDVWSIEEETQEELMSEAESGSDLGLDSGDDRLAPVGLAVAKPKKKVRFALPDEE